MRMGKVLILAGALLLMGAGCRECNCGGTGQKAPDQAGAPAIPQSNTATQENTASIPSPPVEATSGSAPTPQPAVPQPMGVHRTIPEPQVTQEELNDPSFNSKLPQMSRRSLIILRKLQESGQIRQPTVTPSTGPHKPHTDKIEKQN